MMRSVWGMLGVLLVLSTVQASDFSFSLGIGKSSVNESGAVPPWTFGATLYPMSPMEHRVYPEVVVNYWRIQQERGLRGSAFSASALDDTYVHRDSYGGIDWEGVTTGLRIVVDSEARQRETGKKAWGAFGGGLLTQWVEPNRADRIEPTFHASAFTRIGFSPGEASEKTTFIEIEYQQLLDRSYDHVPSMVLTLKLGHRVSL